MKVLAIDPGYERLGIAILERVKGNKKDRLIFSECFKTSAKDSFSERLLSLGTEINTLIEQYHPDTLAIETLFLTTNHKTAMKVAEARGVVIFEAARAGLRICEYSPPEIKMAVTGYGKSDKKQIISMIPKLIALDKEIKYDDEYDAIAAGITCLACVKEPIL